MFESSANSSLLIIIFVLLKLCSYAHISIVPNYLNLYKLLEKQIPIN